MSTHRILTQVSDPVISFQMSDDLHGAILQAALLNGRSFETELLMRLATSLQQSKAEQMSSAQWMEFIFRPLEGSEGNILGDIQED